MVRLVDQRCSVCDLPYEPNEDFCRNPICKRTHRWFKLNYAIAMRDGTLEEVIGQYKFEGKHQWADIFARVLVGFLEENADLFRGFDLIVANPTFVDSEQPFDHTRRVIELAHVESRGEWPFDVGVGQRAIIKTARTPKMTKQPTWQKRDEVAVNDLRKALRVPDPKRTAGKAILVYDDVFTDGHTLDEVARCLRTLGKASEVCGVTLTRQPWNKR
jgi:predicted amidophosphoribosyltransferase